MTRLVRAVNHYLFAPASLRDLALVRIVVFGSQLLFFLPSLHQQLILGRGNAALYAPIPALKVFMAPFGWGARPAPETLVVVWAVAIVAGIGATIGLFTRPSMLAAAAANTMLVAHEYSYNDYHHPEAVMIIALWALAFAPSGRVWSVDALRRRLRAARARRHFEPDPADERSAFARWPLRLVQVLFALVYLSAAISKLKTGGLDWFNGHTLAFYLLQDGLRFDSSLGVFLSTLPALAIPVSVGAVLFELTFFVVLLRPRLAWLYLPVGAGMHTGIYLLQRAPFFQYIALYVVFIESLRRWRPGFLPAPAAPAGRWTVVYDGLCPLCIRSMTVLDFFDTRRRLDYVDLESAWPRAAALLPGASIEDARHAMHVVAPDGQVYRGFHAFREVTRALPLFRPLRPLLFVPGLDAIGSWVYARVAGRRGRVVCRAETCEI